ncbi:hypothetical protein G6F59_017774 [Rhizopus arrhizus]|nr:hypothetical protein G6F59_017774 [Rhizopus arrhizus]
MLVNLTLSGTATSGTDYTGAVSSVTIPANATSATFNIVPVADTQVESDETCHRHHRQRRLPGGHGQRLAGNRQREWRCAAGLHHLP